MTRAARTGGGMALAALAVAAILWWESGAWQLGDMPTRGMLRVAGFALAAGVCHGLAAWLRKRQSG